MWRWLVIFVWAWPVWAEDAPGQMCSEGRWGHVECIRAAHFAFDLCHQIEAEGRRHRIDPHFLARLFWQESRFDPNALSHANARGLAQFIDSTAALRGLKDSYNPAEAVEKSAHYLAEMTQKYGNVGFAAIGYNGGERRAEAWIGGANRLPTETRNYVKIITGLSAEDWRVAPDAAPDLRLDEATSFVPACITLAKTRKVSRLRLTPPEPPKPKTSPWGVQVTYGTSLSNAKSKLARLPRACRAGKVDFIAQKARRNQSYIAARLGAADRRAASSLCNRIRSAGCRCAVYRN